MAKRRMKIIRGMATDIYPGPESMIGLFTMTRKKRT
jgi:hypothetical protein